MKRNTTTFRLRMPPSLKRDIKAAAERVGGGLHLMESELRITFSGPRFLYADEVTGVIREALARAFPEMKFTVRYRTSRTFHPSWVSLTWQGDLSETDVERAISIPLSNWRAAYEAKLQQARERLLKRASGA